MEDEKEKWIEAIFSSLKDTKRAKPNQDLYAKIEQEIYSVDAKIISLTQLRLAVAVAVLLVILNVFALQQAKNNQIYSTNLNLEHNLSPQLISNLKLYE